MGSGTGYGTWVASGASSPLSGECFQKGDPSRLAQEALLGVASEDILISPHDEGHCRKGEILYFFRQQRCAVREKKLLKMVREGEKWRALEPHGEALGRWGRTGFHSDSN